MASRELERIRKAVLNGRYALTEHAYEEMNNDTSMYWMSSPRSSPVRSTNR